jgi:hypothetical protein
MRGDRRTVMAVLVLLLGAAGLRAADDAADKLAEQKKAAEANWGLLDQGEPAKHETAHLLLYAPSAYEKRLEGWGTLLEKQYETARKGLDLDPKDEKWWPGKLAVYLFAERDDFTAFVRRVEKRRLDAGESGTYEVISDVPHVAASPPRGKGGPTVEVQAAQQLASAMLHRKVGPKVPVPDWVLSGFGRATYGRTVPVAAAADRAQAVRLVRAGRTAMDVWGSIDADEAVVLQASLVDFLAYGPAASKFLAFAAAYEPEENMEKKTAWQALDAVSLKPDALNKAWQTWALRQR